MIIITKPPRISKKLISNILILIHSITETYAEFSIFFINFLLKSVTDFAVICCICIRGKIDIKTVATINVLHVIEVNNNQQAVGGM